MRRFIVNRWWATILAFALTFASATLVVSAAWAEKIHLNDGNDPLGGGVGDPDAPTGNAIYGRARPDRSGIQAAGDSGSQAGSRMWHIVVLWQGLKGQLFRF